MELYTIGIIIALWAITTWFIYQAGYKVGHEEGLIDGEIAGFVEAKNNYEDLLDSAVKVQFSMASRIEQLEATHVG